MAYAIVPPQIDRGTPAHQHPEPFLHPGVVRETDAGIVIRGAHSIATSVTMADWLFVSYITPLVPGDEDYAISLVVPVGADGLRLLPRRPYATLATSVYDYPLSSRFDEVDTTVVFDDVLVPWEHVFVYRSVERVTAQFHESPAHVTANFQSLVRFGVKLELLAGLAMKLVEVGHGEGDAGHPGDPRRRHRHLLRDLRRAGGRRRALPAGERGLRAPAPAVRLRGDEPAAPAHRRPLQDGARAGRGAFQHLPSSERSFESPETRAATERYYQSIGTPARDRVKLLKLIWDFIGTEYGGRQLQYEMFYSAAQPVVNRRMFRSYDWDAARAMVDRLLSEY